MNTIADSFCQQLSYGYGKYGQVSGQFTFADLITQAKTPTNLAKTDAAWFIATPAMARRKEEVAQSVMTILAMDLDHKDQSAPITIEALKTALQGVFGNSAVLIYSTASATPDAPNWRCVTPLAAPIDVPTYVALQQAIGAAMASVGMVCDSSMERPTQVSFAPNVPPDLRDDMGAPIFYEFALIGDGEFTYTDHANLAVDVMQNIATAREKAQARKEAMDERGDRNPNSPIGAFNKMFSIDDVLSDCGFVEQQSVYGWGTGNWKSPYQRTWSYATEVYPDGRWFSLSNSDFMIKNYGHKTRCSGTCGDAFDVWAHFKYGGDTVAALAAFEDLQAEKWCETRQRLGLKIAAFAEKHAVEIPQGYEYREPEFIWGDWHFLKNQNAFANAITGEVLAPSAFDQAHTMRVSEINVGSDEKPRMVRHKPSKYFALQELGVVHDQMYAPDMPEVFEHQLKDWLNSYNLASVPTAVDGDGWQLCLAHIQKLVPNDWHIVLQWMAYIVQNPGRKVRWALVIKGAEGDGKTTLARIIGAAIGAANVRIVSNESIRSNFNGYAEGSQLVVLEEIRAKGESRYDTMNSLKPMITNDTIDINEKNRRAKNVRNISSFLCLTNYDDALPLDDADRRYHVVFTPFDDAEDVKAAFPAGYFDVLYEKIEYHAGEIRAWLLGVDLSGFDANKLPAIASAGKAKMIEMGRTAGAYTIMELVEDGKNPEINKDFILVSVLTYELSKLDVKLQGPAMAKALTEAGYKFDAVKKINNKSYRVWLRKRSPLWDMAESDRNEAIRLRVVTVANTSMEAIQHMKRK